MLWRSPPEFGLVALRARDLAAAFVVALAAIAFYVSAATLLFQGELAQYLPVAIGSTLLGGALLAAASAWRGALPLASTGPEPATVPVLAAITAGIAAQVSGPALLPTTLTALGLTAAVIGGLWCIGGRRGWGDLMRYLPYPVIGGFLGSIGWLMLTGGLAVSANVSFSLPQAWRWLLGGDDWRWMAGLALGVAIWRATLRFTHPLTLPAVLFLGAAAVHLALAAAGLSLDEARAAGWLLTAFTQAQVQSPWSPASLAQVRWDVIALQLPLILSAVIVATVGLLLSDTSLEIAWDQDADINRDLRVLGWANLGAGALGAAAGGVSISRSLLNRAAGANSRWSGWFKAALCVAALLGGGTLIAMVPRPLLGGVLIYMGLGMLKAWVVDSRHRLPGREHAIVVTMVLVTAVLGFLPAVCIGVLACCVEFTVRSAQLQPVRRLLPRSGWPAKTERGPVETAVLHREGEGLRVVELQGALFFGSASKLAGHVETVLDSGCRCVLFDFQHVRGLDTSAGQSFGRLFKAAQRRGLRVELSGLSASHRARLQAGGALLTTIREHPDIDAALEAWDRDVLSSQTLAGAYDETPPGIAPQWMEAAFVLCQVASGDRLFNQGEASDTLYLLRSGKVTIHAQGADGPVLLRSLHAGSAIGEMGFLRDVPRTATATVSEDAEMWVLTRERFLEQARREPAFEAALYRLFLLQMAGRIEQLGTQASQLAR